MCMFFYHTKILIECSSTLKVVSTELIKMVNADVAKSQPFNYYFFLKKKKKKSKLGFKEFYVIEYFENSKGS